MATQGYSRDGVSELRVGDGLSMSRRVSAFKLVWLLEDAGWVCDM
jgi:hypothetical protein